MGRTYAHLARPAGTHSSGGLSQFGGEKADWTVMRSEREKEREQADIGTGSERSKARRATSSSVAVAVAVLLISILFTQPV